MRFTLIVIVIAIALEMCLNAAAHGQTNAISAEWVFISTPLNWQAPPPQTGIRIHSAPAVIIVLYPNGQYAEVACILIRQNDKSMTISHGDGFVVRSGTWKAADDELEARSSIVFRTVNIKGPPLPEPPLTERFTIKRSLGPKEILDSRGGRYAPSSKFRDMEELSAVIETRP
jgi:hypothetical protein